MTRIVETTQLTDWFQLSGYDAATCCHDQYINSVKKKIEKTVSFC